MEFVSIVLLPSFLGFLISRLWDRTLQQLALGLFFPILGAIVRLTTSSIHDGHNWFALLFRFYVSEGFLNPYFRQIIITLLFPVAVTLVFVALPNKGLIISVTSRDKSPAKGDLR